MLYSRRYIMEYLWAPTERGGIRRHAMRDEFGVYHALRDPAPTVEKGTGIRRSEPLYAATRNFSFYVQEKTH
jgi:hypothetical protein